MNNSRFNCLCSKGWKNNCGCKQNSHKFYCQCEEIANECGCNKYNQLNNYECYSNSNSCNCSGYSGYNYSNAGFSLY